jgi:hypothetical protein
MRFLPLAVAVLAFLALYGRVRSSGVGALIAFPACLALAFVVGRAATPRSYASTRVGW